MPEATWLVFTSRHAARIFLAGLAAPRGKRPLVAAVGGSTREEILRAGWPVDLEGAGRGASALAKELAQRSDMRGATVLHPRSSLAGDDLAALLGEAGAVVRGVEAYRTLPAEVSEEEGALRRAVHRSLREPLRRPALPRDR
jgi:uroporphyrinogen-III synthase